MKFLAIIPARAGSKGIPDKNIRAFCGKPLLGYAIAEAKKSKHLSRIIVSTESEEIAKVAQRCGAEVPFLRPAELAGDKSKIIDAIEHLLAKLKKDEGYTPECIVLLQPTSPLRTVEDIDGTIELLLARDADSAITVSPVEPRVFVKEADDSLTLATDPSFLSSTNRQELRPTVAENGAMVYVNRVSTLLASRHFLGGTLVGFQTPRWRAVDLDEPQDFVVGELIYKNRAEIEGKIRDFT